MPEDSFTFFHLVPEESGVAESFLSGRLQYSHEHPTSRAAGEVTLLADDDRDEHAQMLYPRHAVESLNSKEVKQKSQKNTASDGYMQG